MMATGNDALNQSKKDEEPKNPQGRPRNELPRKEGNRHLTPLSRLAECVKDAREAAGLSVQEAAKKAKVSPSFWYGVESATLKASIPSLWKVADSLGLDREKLVLIVWG